MSIVAGLDGCPGGWVQVMVSADGQGKTQVMVVPDIAAVVSNVDSGRLAAVGIDIPIGLPDSGSRRCDIEARKMIGPRRNSVFPAPARGLLGSETYEEASARSRAISGKGISRQTFAILPRIHEVDLLMTPDRQRHLVEVHPEVCFTILAGGPMAHHKATNEGRAERLAALRRVFPDVDEHGETNPTNTARRRPRCLRRCLERAPMVSEDSCSTRRYHRRQGSPYGNDRLTLDYPSSICR